MIVGAFVCGVGLLLCGTIYQGVMALSLGQWLNFTHIQPSYRVVQEVFMTKWLTISSVMVMSLLFNVIIVKQTKHRYLFISPIELLGLSLLVVMFLSFASHSSLNVMVMGTSIVATIICLYPWILTKLMGSHVKPATTLATTSLCHVVIALLLSRLFKREKATCLQLLEIKTPWAVRYAWEILFIGLLMLTLMLTALAQNSDQVPTVNIILFDAIVIGNESLTLISVVTLVLGSVFAWAFYRCYIQSMTAFITALQSFIPRAKVATDFVYLLQDAKSFVLIGFFVSLIGSGVGLYYLNYYVGDKHLICPNLILIGLFGIVVAKLCDGVGGWRGSVLGCLVQGTLVTLVPTLSFLAFETTTIPLYFQQIDWFFISQWLDIFCIF